MLKEIPSGRAINKLRGGEKHHQVVALEVIKEWLKPKEYEVKAEEEIETDLTESYRDYTDLVAEKNGETLRIKQNIAHRRSKEKLRVLRYLLCCS